MLSFSAEHESGSRFFFNSTSFIQAERHAKDFFGKKPGIVKVRSAHGSTSIFKIRPTRRTLFSQAIDVLAEYITH